MRHPRCKLDLVKRLICVYTIAPFSQCCCLLCDILRHFSPFQISKDLDQSMNEVFMKYDGDSAESKAVDYLQTQVRSSCMLFSTLSKALYSLSFVFGILRNRPSFCSEMQSLDVPKCSVLGQSGVFRASGLQYSCARSSTCTFFCRCCFCVTVTLLDVQLMCCGVHNYTSWMGTPWYNSHNSTVPHSCCKNSTGCTGRLDQLHLLNLKVQDSLAANV